MLLDAIKYAGELADDAAQHLHYAERYPWTQMGQALGMSRQAARQRWGIPGRGGNPGAGDGEGLLTCSAKKGPNGHREREPGPLGLPHAR